jgi:hypothetical protein
MLKSVLISMVAFVFLIHAYTRSTNVIPGEADYPILNTRPVDFVTVTFQIPASVHVHFTLFYAGAFGRESHAKPSTCHYAVRTGSETEYTIALHEYWKAEPLNLTLQSRLPDESGLSKDIGMYSALIPVDRYEAGRCNWQFEKLVYSLEDDPTTQMPVFYLANDAHGGSNLFRFLCAKREATRESRHQELCGGPRTDYTAWLYRRPQERNAFFNNPQANVQNAAVARGSTVAVEFHDIDNVVQSPPDEISAPNHISPFSIGATRRAPFGRQE